MMLRVMLDPALTVVAPEIYPEHCLGLIYP